MHARTPNKLLHLNRSESRSIVIINIYIGQARNLKACPWYSPNKFRRLVV